ncbi:MAG: hypothetical protein FJ387_20860 [Verrucomicrobia bacterium]|nr:hypothetical protein [Verrucomicrobiota bacterium]
MKLGIRRFNTYLALVGVACLAVGCAGSGKGSRRAEASTLRLHLETDTPPGDKSAVVPVYRASPVPVQVTKAPFLDEGHLIDAAVVDVVGGFAIQVRYDFHGTLALQNATTAHRGRRLAVHTMFTEARWLAAPIMATPIMDGVLTFTPDATREEAERIVRGLNNLATRLGNRPKPAKTKAAKGKS